MPYFVGALLALAIATGASFAGLDRGRSFYPTVLLVVASYYDLFAVMGGSASALGVETGVFFLFAAAAVVGFKLNPWIVVVGLAMHGAFDLVHGGLIANPGVPVWWPAFCMSYDLAAAAYLSQRLGALPEEQSEEPAIVVWCPIRQWTGTGLDERMSPKGRWRPLRCSSSNRSATRQ